MKQLLTIVLCFATLIVQAQTKIKGRSYTGTQVECQPSLGIIYPVNGDTLFLNDTSIHFIKIGEKVLEIKSLMFFLPILNHPPLIIPCTPDSPLHWSKPTPYKDSITLIDASPLFRNPHYY